MQYNGSLGWINTNSQIHFAVLCEYTLSIQHNTGILTKEVQDYVQEFTYHNVQYNILKCIFKSK